MSETALYGNSNNTLLLKIAKLLEAGNGLGPFRLSLSPSSVSLAQGESQVFTASMSLRSGLPEIATPDVLDATLPTGVTVGTLNFGNQGDITGDGTDIVTTAGVANYFALGQTLYLEDNTTTYTVVAVLNGTQLQLSNTVPLGGPYSFDLVTVSTAQAFTFTLTADADAPAITSDFFNVAVTSASGTVTRRGSVTVEPNDFTVAVTNDADTIAQGGSAAFTVTLTQTSGITPVNTTSIVVSGLPGGVTASVADLTISIDGGTTEVTLTASGVATIGAATFTVTVSTGDYEAADTGEVEIIEVVAAPLFTVAVAGDGDTMPQGTASSFTVTLSTVNAPLTTKNIYLSGLPEGVSTQYVKNNAAATAGSGAPFSEAPNREISTDGGSVTIFISAHGAATIGAATFTVHVVTEQETIAEEVTVTVSTHASDLASAAAGVTTYASRAAAITGGVDSLAGLQAALDALAPGETLILDGWANISGTLFKPEDVNFVGIGQDLCGLYLLDDSSAMMFSNTNQDASVPVAGVGRWADMTLDGNEDNQTKFEDGDIIGTAMFVVGVWLVGCATQTVANVAMRNVRTFGWLVSNVQDSQFFNLTAQWDNSLEDGVFDADNHDGFHLYRAENCIFSRLWSNGGDDTVAVNTNEGCTAIGSGFPGESRFPDIATGGNTINVLVEDIWMQNVYSAARLIAYETLDEENPNFPLLAPCTVRNVVFRNFRGSALSTSSDGSSWVDGLAISPQIETFTLDGWAVTGSGNNIRIPTTGGMALTFNNIGTLTREVNVDIAHVTAGNYNVGGVGTLVPLEFARYKLDDANDSLGKYHLVNSGATFVAGKIGNCARFAGGQKMVANAMLRAALDGDFTVAGWVNFTTGQLSRILGQYGTTAEDTRWELKLLADNTLNGRVATTGTNGSTASAAQTASAWHFVVMQWNNTLHGTQIKIDNGSWLTDTITAASTSIQTTGTADAFAIGAGDGGELPFTGDVDAVRVYAGLVSDAALTALYNAGTGTEG